MDPVFAVLFSGALVCSVAIIVNRDFLPEPHRWIEVVAIVGLFLFVVPVCLLGGVLQVVAICRLITQKIIERRRGSRDHPHQ